MLILKAYIYLFITANLIFISGFVFRNIFLRDLKENILITGILGTFFLSIISLFVNFIYPLTVFVNTLIAIIIFIIFLIKINKILLKKFFFYTILCSLISFIIVIFDTIYRPDAGLYHLPFTKIINDYKIILGVNHLEFRYGHTSILQYLAAINNNYFFFDIGVLLPLIFFFSISVVFFFKKIFSKENKIIKYLAFLFLFYILYEMNRYSEFGNDAPAHILFLLTVIIFLNKNNNLLEISNNYKIVSTLSIYIFCIKSTLFFILLLPLYYIFIEKNFFLLKLKYNIFLVLIIFAWFIRNFLISSCFVYPLSFTCNSDVLWSSYHSYTQSHPNFVSDLTEAWSKGISDNNRNIEGSYVENFNWVSTWLKNHFIKILERLSPLFLIFFLLIVFKGKYFNKKDFDIYKNKINFLLIINITGLIYWFIEFPTFRYGKSYIVCTLIILFIYFINFIFKKENIEKKFFKIVLALCFVVILTKNFKRVYLNYSNEYLNYPFPEIYSLNSIGKIENHIPFIKENEIIFYRTNNNGLCMYGESPCSCCSANMNQIKAYHLYSYKLYSIKQ